MDEMENYGKIHAISSDCGGIMECVDSGQCSFQQIKEYQEKFLKKYAEYLYDCNKEKSVNMIYENLWKYHFMGASCDDFTFIYQPPWIVGVLAQRGRVALKFKREKNDNL